MMFELAGKNTSSKNRTLTIGFAVDSSRTAQTAGTLGGMRNIAIISLLMPVYACVSVK